MINLKDKKVLITGASGGIGGALVKKFLSLNAEVLGTGTNSEKLEKLQKDFNKIKVKKFDISSHAEIENHTGLANTGPSYIVTFLAKQETNTYEASDSSCVL